MYYPLNTAPRRPQKSANPIILHQERALIQKALLFEVFIGQLALDRAEKRSVLQVHIPISNFAINDPCLLLNQSLKSQTITVRV